jgi:acetoin utilization protein AcuC
MKIAFLYHEDLASYSFGEGHPLTGERFSEFFSFFTSRCTSFKDKFEEIEPQPATNSELELVHTKDYIKAIQSASKGVFMFDIHRYVSVDNLNPATGYIPKDIDEGARIVVGISLLAGELVAQGKFKKAIGIGGGMHHAKTDYGEGFCFYNDVAVCVKNLKAKYNLKRILVLDTDAHAGNGTKEIFYADPEVLFIDIHQDPRTLYPGTGFIQEVGSGKGEGFTVNLSVLAGTSNKAYEYIFEEIVFPLAREFKPEIIIRYGGSDPHYLDTLTNLGLTLEGFKMIGHEVSILAKELTQGKAVDLLLSGYNLEVLPFAWSALISGLLDLDIDLSGLKEESLPSPDSRLKETKDMVSQLKKLLKKYWKCMEK